MYTLRIIEEFRKDKDSPFEQVVENFELGSSYAKLTKGLTSEFDEILSSEFPNHDKDSIHALICGRNGDIYFIEENNENKAFYYFIMSDSGKTFEKL